MKYFSTKIVNAPLSFVGVSVDYGEGFGVNEINLSIDDGLTTVLLGPSGSGKSTLLRLANGMVLPHSGRVLRRNRPLDYDQIEKERRMMGYAIQGIGLFPHMNVKQNITVMANIEGWSTEKIDERYDQLLRLVNLPRSFSKKYPHQLSGGEMQRVGLCRALMLDPEILLLDEPFSALDPITRAEIHSWFLDIKKKAAKTTILVTHDIPEALTLSDVIVVLRKGRIIARGYRGEKGFRNETELMKLFQRDAAAQ